MNETEARIIAFLKARGRPQSGYEIQVGTLISIGKMYPALARLEQIGNVLSAWESATKQGTDRRRLYSLPASAD